jgi:uncharacterized integral membrane protein
MKRFRLISILTICILFIVFVFQNSQTSRARFLMFEWYIPTALLICISVLIGVVLGILASMRNK